ncbi:hypothetical protein [Acidisphaera rubrifaciens]|uniref:MetA-pathway of phenol degradation n=1 Tax=Acidisphaera rubrifaciens HS-AP3 TaxID=1231350 RepID=A0A0D6P5H9_9PROT|nr:hypothetical protein [Acidisphaera rubrifaciens]GAN76114.1 hypothetical protein Asru_0054_02 [Acidisphaera rubrifaciens HS-AP3]
MSATIPLTVMMLMQTGGAVAQSSDAAVPSTVPPLPSDSTTEQGGLGTYFSEWFQRVDTALATQPSWAAPLIMATPRIVELFRFDTSMAEVRTNVNLDNYGLGRGLSLVPNETTQVTLGIPPYEVRTGGRQPGAGFADLPFITVKERLFTATEQEGNYLVTAFLGAGAPTGVPLYTQNTYTITPGLYGGKGWGRFDVEASSSVSFPVEDVAHIGKSIVSNLVFQYHIDRIFWPEIEFNHTYWIDGVRGGRSQLFTTIGLVLGRFELIDRLKMTVGAGYQVALSPAFITRPVVVPTYRNALVTTFRLSF